MAPIEIGPDGTPIVTPNPSTSDVAEEKKVTSDFVAQVQEHIDSEKVEKIPEVQTIPPTPIASGPGNPAPQHAHLIDSARQFNQSIGNPSPPAPVTPPKVENLPTTQLPAKMTTHATSGARVPTARERVAMNPPPVQITMNPSLVARIRVVLKDNGMDSQQQEQALQRIAEILQS